MWTVFRNILVVLVLSAGAINPVGADQSDDGTAAYKRGDYAEAVRLLRPLAEQGDATAQSRLGFQYAEGQGVPQDYAEAVKWYRKAAEQGDAPAQSNLGVMYEHGKGVSRNHIEAAKWYRMAAEQGLASAQTNLGHKYGAGEGVPLDFVRAHMWFNLAAAQGYENGRKYRDKIARLMSPAQVAEAQKLAREWKPK